MLGKWTRRLLTSVLLLLVVAGLVAWFYAQRVLPQTEGTLLLPGVQAELRIVRDEGLAEEVTEDALFQAWREANRFDVARGKVITWLLTICRSRALDALRRADIAECVEDPDEFRSQEASLMAEPEQLIAQFEPAVRFRPRC